ncbi:MAG: asparagine synthase-related protein [Candidatus Ratteibacteria bacterium]|nr:asparagine synthase-related protein [Candidatus Ratteibacteria bacterium]
MAIAGILNKGILSKDSMISMIEVMKHENFYKSEFYEFDSILLGNVGITQEKKILFNNDKTIMLLSEGEVFYNFNADSNKRNLLSLYEKEGINFVNYIKGQFVIVIFRISDKKVFIITDHYGFKPLYYTNRNDKFIFASELKAIVKHLRESPSINVSAMADFAMFNYPLENKTFIKNIERMPPASIWEFDLNTLPNLQFKKREYWKFENLLNKEQLTNKEATKQCGEVFKNVVGGLLNKDTEIGLTLTGGYDSRTILSAIDCNRYKINSFTYKVQDDKQSIIAREIARGVGCNHITQEIGSEFNKDVDEFLEKTVWFTDGLCNIIHTELLYVFKKLHNLINPCFTGIGGSELTRGLQNTGLPFNKNLKDIIFSNNPLQTLDNIGRMSSSYGLFSKEFIEYNKGEIKIEFPFELSVNERALYFTLFEIFRKYYGAMTLLESFYTCVRLPYIDYDFINFLTNTPFSILQSKQFSQNPFNRLKGQQISSKIIQYNNPKLLFTPTDRGYPPLLNLYPIALPVILFYSLKQKLSNSSNKSSTENIMRSVAKRIIEESRTLKRDYYNVPRLKELSRIYPNWDIENWREITKIVTFEIWLRQLENTNK